MWTPPLWPTPIITFPIQQARSSRGRRGHLSISFWFATSSSSTPATCSEGSWRDSQTVSLKAGGGAGSAWPWPLSEWSSYLSSSCATLCPAQTELFQSRSIRQGLFSTIQRNLFFLYRCAHIRIEPLGQKFNHRHVSSLSASAKHSSGWIYGQGVQCVSAYGTSVSNLTKYLLLSLGLEVKHLLTKKKYWIDSGSKNSGFFTDYH